MQRSSWCSHSLINASAVTFLESISIFTPHLTTSENRHRHPSPFLLFSPPISTLVSFLSSFIQMPCCCLIQSEARLLLSGKHTLRVEASCAPTHAWSVPWCPERTFCYAPKRSRLKGNTEVNMLVPVATLI